jgi:hypothetical protein
MHTRTVHITDESTVLALSERCQASSLRQVARSLGLPDGAIATLSAILHHQPSTLTTSSENDLRCRLGLVPLAAPRLVWPCPTCGALHGEGLDCHGAPVVAVILLAPGETVRRPGTPDPRLPCYRPRLSRDPATRLAQLATLTRQAQAELAT